MTSQSCDCSKADLAAACPSAIAPGPPIQVWIFCFPDAVFWVPDSQKPCLRLYVYIYELPLGLVNHTRIQREVQGIRTPPPLKNHKNIGFLSSTGPNPLKNSKATKPAFNVGQSSTRQRNTKTPFKWCFAVGPIMARLSAIWILSFLKKKCHSWTPSEKTFWIRAWKYRQYKI